MNKTINSFFSKSPGVLQTKTTQKMNPEQDGGDAEYLLCTDTTPFMCGGTGMVQGPGTCVVSTGTV